MTISNVRMLSCNQHLQTCFHIDIDKTDLQIHDTPDNVTERQPTDVILTAGKNVRPSFVFLIAMEMISLRI